MTEPIKFILVPMGSAGDVHPLLWLGRILREQGHQVVVVAQAAVARLVDRAGLPLVSVGNEQDQTQVLHHKDIWHPRRAFDLLASYMTPFAREMLPAIDAQLEPGRTVLVAGSIAFAARLVGELKNIPVLTVHLQPLTLMSADEMPVVMAGMEWLRGAPAWMRRALLSLGHRRVDGALRVPLGKLRREIGVHGPYPRGIMRQWIHAPDGVICLFPEWYAAKARDWPSQSVVTRFPLYDEPNLAEGEVAAETFARAGEPPIVITPGSANAQAARFLKQAADACVQLNRRAMLLTRYPEQVPAGLPDSIRAFNYIPFNRVFPHAAAVVHHGGIGTTSQCLAAGVPQLIMPMAHDQPDNAARLKRFGVGDYLYPKAFTTAAIAKKLGTLLASENVRRACLDYRHKMRRQMSDSAMGELVETMAQRALRVRQINGMGVPA